MGEILVSIYNPEHLIVDVDVPCDVFDQIKIGTPAKVLDNNLFLTHVQARLDENSHLCPADIDINCQHCLIGQTLSVELEVARHLDSISIPVTAIFIKNGKQYV